MKSGNGGGHTFGHEICWKKIQISTAVYTKSKLKSNTIALEVVEGSKNLIFLALFLVAYLDEMAVMVL